MRAIDFGLTGLAVALIALTPADLDAQGRGKARGHDRDDRGRVIVWDRDDDDDSDDRSDDDDFRRRGIVIRGDRDDLRERVDRRIGHDRDGGVVFRDRDGRVIVIGRGGFDERFRADRGRGPSFCRSGAGHPVFGRRWCLEKGFGLGGRDDVFFDDGRVIFWDDDGLVVVRDSRFRSDRSPWERVLDRILFWAD